MSSHGIMKVWATHQKTAAFMSVAPLTTLLPPDHKKS